MIIDLLKRVESCWQAIVTVAPTQPQLSTAAQHLILSVLCLRLSEQSGILDSVRLHALQDGQNLHLHLCQLLQAVHAQFKLPIPQAWWLPLIQFEDAVVRQTLVCLCASDLPLRSSSPNRITAAVALGLVYEKLLGYVQEPLSRKSSGIYYTPPSIADYIVQQTVDVRLATLLPRVLDPACGSGVFLLTAYQHCLDWQLQSRRFLPQAEREQILLNCIYGVDIDPQAVAVTQIALLLTLLADLPDLPQPLPDLSHNIRCGNAVIGSDFEDDVLAAAAIPPMGELLRTDTRPFDWQLAFPEVMQSGGFDVVIGNPPYIDAERMTTCLPQWRKYCVQRYQTAVGNWDLFCIFIEKALDLCKPDGLTSLIVPNKLTSAPYAAPARALLAQTNQLLCVRDYAQVKVFPVAVYPLVYVVQKRPPARNKVRCEVMADCSAAPSPSIATAHLLAYDRFLAKPGWQLTLTPQQFDIIARLQQRLPTLGDLAQVSGAATVAEAYALQALIQNSYSPEADDLRLVNSGTIDRYCLLWGKKRLRYLGATYLHPVIPCRITAHLPPRRYQQATQPKLIVSGMAKQLECMLDATGRVLAGKSTVVITAQAMAIIDLHCLLGLLNSHLVNFYFTHSFGGNQLQGGYLRIGPLQLRQIPLPDWDTIDCQSSQQLAAWVRQIIALHQSTSPADDSQIASRRLDRQIDQLVYQLYQLSDAEIAIIESQSQRLD
jgi:hypothetical protein